ncbi:ImpB/MucB/SamB family protein [Necator americanus]|uniref:DNA polymerase eta n=1 Tax=Necator americanus TaxID=51031 RepID=W2TJN9_NECAM|nr:ImpB/MucB/SamB family protein [Necator americanus]ETN81386.1 ImpB/MucB/SamB family protein [Necator americanus]
MDRVIGLIDMDCFYAQVEQRERPELWNTPVIVAQHTGAMTSRVILAVSYEARKFGVKRGMTIPDAKAKCPELNICHVPQGEHADKADIQKYRDASEEIFDVLYTFDDRIIVERASVDEAFLDLTALVDQKIVEIGATELLHNITNDLPLALPTTHIADGNDKNAGDIYDRETSLRSWLDIWCAREVNHLRLAIAAQIMEQMRAKIRECTQFFCSGGVANNKMLAKLVCARHKPRQQTIIPFNFVPVIFEETPVVDVRMLGGKLGHAIQDRLGVATMGDLAAVSYEMIEQHFEGQAQWISQLAKGYDDEPVKIRSNQQSIAVSKNFAGKNALTTVAEVRSWIEGLSKELSKRLVADQVKNKRTAQNVIFGILGETHTSKTLKIGSYSPQVIAEVMWSAAKAFNKAPLGTPPVYNLTMSASRFTEGLSVQSQNIMEWVEKRLEQLEAGRVLLQPPSAAPEPRIFVKGVLKRPADLEGPSTSGVDVPVNNSPKKAPPRKRKTDLESTEVKIDDDGWQVYDPAQFESTTTSAAIPAVESSDIGEISTAVFQELPANIKAEFAHFHKLEQARKLKAAAFEREREKPSGKKRISKTTAKEPPAKKKIEAFFKRDN